VGLAEHSPIERQALAVDDDRTGDLDARVRGRDRGLADPERVREIGQELEVALGGRLV